MRSPPPSSSPSTTQARGTLKRRGRPKEWTDAVRRETIALDIFSPLTNTQILMSVRGSGKGERSLQGLRKRYPRHTYQRCRSQDLSQMHRRINHLRYQHRSGQSPRVFCLEPDKAIRRLPEERPSISDQIRLGSADSLFGYGGSADLTIRFRQNTKPQDTKTTFKVCIEIEGKQAAKAVSVCGASELGDAVERICQPWQPAMNSRKIVALSAVFSWINLQDSPLLDDHQALESISDHVTRLALNNCHLLGVPTVIASFTRLKYLNLQRNRLLTIYPAWMPIGLNVLDLRHNQIASLPDDMTKLSSLRVLALSHNSIKTLPSWLSGFESLNILFVNGNPLDSQSYLDYCTAFQHCKVGTKDESCNLCLSAATNSLKKLLSTTRSSPTTIAHPPRECQCRHMFQEESTRITLTDEGGKLEATNYSEDTRNLKRFLYRESLLTGSSRSSTSVLTLKSLSSAGGLDRLSRLNKNCLMLVHCCYRDPEDSRPPCIHRCVAEWMATGISQAFPQEMLKKQDVDGNTVIHIAASLGATPSALKLCLALGCSATLINRDGETFLHRWKAGHHVPQDDDLTSMIRDLYTMGFDFSLRDIRGNSIFHKSELLTVTFRSMKITMPNYVQRSYFKKNARGKMLSDKMSHELQWPPLSFECALHRPVNLPDIPKLYFPKHGPAVIVSCSDRKERNSACAAQCLLSVSNPLHNLAWLMSVGCTEYLEMASSKVWDCTVALKGILESHADPNDYDDKGVTVLMAFMRALGRQRQLEDTDVECCVSMLLEYGANPRWISRDGDTVLHHAIYFGLPLAVKLLVDAGVNVNARNGKGMSVMALLNETMLKMKSNLTLFASFTQCMAILTDCGAEMEPTLEQELEWN